ncbi:MAG: T9SS type A sorting domain-containing protein, partial [Flavobacterium sp.]|nr:T9SS type A sorting domain-containing protein [Flavobacterium sp.]
MKQFLLLLFATLITNISSAQFTEDFEGTFPPEGWQVADAGAGTRSWVQSTIHAINGKSAFIDRENIGVGNSSEDWLITPAITIGTDFQVNYLLTHTILGDQGTQFQIRVSTMSQSDLSTFVTVESLSEADVAQNSTLSSWISLANYENQSIFIAFVRTYTQPYASLDGDRWVIDDVYVGASLKTEEFENSNSISIYPNPATDFFNFVPSRSAIDSIEIFNILGQRVLWVA